MAGLAGRPPCLPQSGPYGCWVSWETSLSITQSGPYGCWVSWETSLSTTQSGPYGWVSWETFDVCVAVLIETQYTDSKDVVLNTRRKCALLDSFSQEVQEEVDKYKEYTTRIKDKSEALAV